MIVFLDTETTSLVPYSRRPWEIAAIVRPDDGGPDREYTWMIDVADLDLDGADPKALDVGRFHERHPQATDDPDARYRARKTGAVIRAGRALIELADLTASAHIVGLVPWFDTETLERRMYVHGITPTWHYHLTDVGSRAVGWLGGRGIRVDPPVKSEDLSRACGVEPPTGDDRHTALGDTRWVRDWYDATAAPAGPPARAFLGERPCSNPGCACHSTIANSVLRAIAETSD